MACIRGKCTEAVREGLCGSRIGCLRGVLTGVCRWGSVWSCSPATHYPDPTNRVLPQACRGLGAALCLPLHPQSLARACAWAHLPRDAQIWGRGFRLINHLQLIVLSAKVV